MHGADPILSVPGKMEVVVMEFLLGIFFAILPLVLFVLNGLFVIAVLSGGSRL
jgi:hypothetical protein